MSIRHLPFFSGALFSRKTCLVYLPKGYEASEQSYPVIYLLHGMYEGESDWTERGQAEQTLDRLMEGGDLRECIVVMPNDGGYGHGTFYTDWYDGTGNFEQYFIHDLMPSVERSFRTIPSKEARALAGLSMGGFGSVYLALRHPELFGAAASLSGALASADMLPDKEFARSEFPRILGPASGPYARERNIFRLAAERLSEQGQPELYFDCGTDDYLYGINTAFAGHLNQIGYPHQFQSFSGAHNWEYWTEHLEDALRFVNGYFERA